MPDKKKIHFWQLVFIFGSITIVALTLSYGSYQGNQAQMMSSTMGEMMQMHLNDVTVRDLIVQQEQIETTSQTQTSEHSSHHDELDSFITTVHFLSTATIVILLPFILAGSVFLAIIWLK